jgi:ppGpp synthetase/RelA/SpoT-type nucleotidyltranferase
MLIKNHINRMAKKVSDNYILARRLKRLPTIIDKLERPTLDSNTSNAIQLTRMQDIGGCRVIFETVDEVYACLERLKRSTSVHKIIAIDDRLTKPKVSGYRGIHVVFSCYDNDDDSTSPWKKHKIEVQLRTRLQHAWATCVEMIDIFEKTSLKTRMGGDENYREFFKLTANLMAVDEGSTIYNEEQCLDFRLNLSQINGSLKLIGKLEDYKIASQVVGYGGKDKKKLDGQMLILLQENLNGVDQFTVTREYFAKAKSHLAVAAYHKFENDPAYTVVVLVSVKSVEDLKKAYPNYFVDSSMFIKFYLQQIRALTISLKAQADQVTSELKALQDSNNGV